MHLSYVAAKYQFCILVCSSVHACARSHASNSATASNPQKAKLFCNSPPSLKTVSLARKYGKYEPIMAGETAAALAATTGVENSNNSGEMGDARAMRVSKISNEKCNK
jgi:hypothetical protein